MKLFSVFQREAIAQSSYAPVSKPSFTYDTPASELHWGTHQFQQCPKDDDPATLRQTTWIDDEIYRSQQVSVNKQTLTYLVSPQRKSVRRLILAVTLKYLPH